MANERPKRPDEPPAMSTASSSGITPVHSMGLENDNLLRALRRQPVLQRPIWFMRQAGRCLPKYRELAAKHGFEKLAHDPALAAEVTLLPLEYLDVDAVITFSDILIPLMAMGVKITYEKGHGPKIHEPVTPETAGKLSPPDPEKLEFVGDTIARVKHALAGSRPVLGFCGAPFTLASYLIEGGTSKDLRHTRKWLYSDPIGFTSLLDMLAETAAVSLAGQVAAGAHAVQIFDTWAGHLPPMTYRRLAGPATANTISRLREKLGTARSVPVILYVNGVEHHLDEMSEIGADCLALDWRVSIADVRKRIGPHMAVQGNLDPAALYAPKGELDRMTRAVVRDAGIEPGHIFNLGHGVLPDTPVEALKTVIAAVRDEDQQLKGWGSGIRE